jgi:TetR/AcrR family transcriptional regulator, transcriptional repressor for nem operon
MNKAARTRQYILERTAPLFNRKGFDGTSLTDLMKATGLTKGALYGNFRDKEEIAEKAFRFAIYKVRDRVAQDLSGKVTYKARLLALLDFYRSYVFASPVEGGCPLLNTAVEADDNHTSMRKIVTRELTRTVTFMSELIERGVESGEFKKGTDAGAMAYVFFCAVEGAIMFSRVERSREPMDIIINHCQRLLDQISI